MAKIKQGILGGFSGKVANVVGTSWKGRAVMKSQPLSVANPRTTGQVEQRAKFSKIAELASKMLTTYVQQVENPISGNISGYNRFVKDNKAAFGVDGNIVRANFVSGGGNLANLDSVVVSASAATQKITLGWQNPESMSPLRLTDKVYAAVVTYGGKLFGVTSGEVTREVEEVEIVAVEGAEAFLASATMYVIYAVVSADGRDVSVLTAAKSVTTGA